MGAVWVLQLTRRRAWSDRTRRIVLYRGPLSIALLVMAAGLVYSVHYADAARQALRDKGRTQFREQTDRVETALRDKFLDLDRLLAGVRALVVTHPAIAPAELASFARAAEVASALQGVRGLGYVARNAHADGAVLTEAQRAAAEAAMRSGQSALLRAAPAPDAASGALFWYLLPVYQQAATPATETERENGLRGWALAQVLLAQLLADDKVFDARQVQFQLYDNPDLQAASLVYDSAASGADAAPTPAAGQARALVRPVALGGQAFYLRTTPTAAFEAAYQTREHLQSVLLGSGLSVLLAMVLWLLMVGRARALYLARSMTSELERLAMVARRTSNAVYFADTEWRITWVNEGFTRMSGFAPEDALGKRPSELLHSPLADPNTAHNIDIQAEVGKRVEIQVLQRSKQGKDYWADLEVLPMLSSRGQITGYLSVQSDVTEEVQAKAALLIEKERTENILSGTLVGTWESNLLTGEQRWNDRWCGMMGYSRAEVVPSLAQFWLQRLHPLDREKLNLALAECVAGRSDSYDCDVRAQRKDGSWMWILSRAKVMSRARDGRPEWLGGIHTDITESKQLELSLRDMEAFLDRAGRIAGVGAWQIDLQTREVVFSAQTCAIHGMAPDFKPSEEVALSFYPEADRKRLREAVLRAEADGTPWDMVVEFHNVQGEQLWVRIFGEVGFDESGPVRLVGAFQDVTRDRLAQREVERSGNLLRGAIEAINEAFVLFDPQDRLVLCNDKYRAMYTKSADLMLPGASFESIIRGGAERGQYVEALGRVDEWVAERMAAHRTGNVSMEQRLDDGRWLKIMERR
ncbi:MAG: PAS domain S-box protein, partial [Rhodoferax sp.]|nr:PAS domain S-box protein [Rhodoferax sp.]